MTSLNVTRETPAIIRITNPVTYLMFQIAVRVGIEVLESDEESAKKAIAFSPLSLESFLTIYGITDDELMRLGYAAYEVRGLEQPVKPRDRSFEGVNIRSFRQQLEREMKTHDPMVEDAVSCWSTRSEGPHGFVIVRSHIRASFSPDEVSLYTILALVDKRKLLFIEGNDHRIFVMNVGPKITARLTTILGNQRAFDGANHWYVDNTVNTSRPVTSERVMEVLSIR